MAVSMATAMICIVLAIKILQIQKRFAHLRSGHPGEEGSPPAQSVAAQAEQRPGEEVPPRHQVEEEDVHDQTHLS